MVLDYLVKVELTRRSLFEGAIVLGEGALATALLHSCAPILQPKLRYIFERSHPNLESLPLVALKQVRESYTPSIEEQASDIEYRQREYHALQGKKATHVESHKDLLARFEPDSAFANKLIDEAKKSIDHMVEFLQSNYIKPRKINFVIPQRAEDIDLSVRGTRVYLIADVIERRLSIYNFEGIEKSQFVATYERGKLGSYWTITRIVQGMPVIEDYIIFYGTTGSPFDLIDTPTAEVLHSYMNPYRTRHAVEELKATNNI